jgi:SAM-dependent methyltransferase
VPSPESTVEKMLDVAKVTPQDFVVDLGSGDGRNVIAAAKRGARALGVEYNPDMVELSKRNAAKAGVSEKASFVQGDMYAAEFSQATVLALFLLPENLTKLRDKFAALKPGTRIVANTFGIEDWTADESITISDDCLSWCTVLLYFVPARVDGTWQTAQGPLTLKQQYQLINGTFGTSTIENGRVRGEEVSFTAGGVAYRAKVSGDNMTGTSKAAGPETPWKATRVPK